LQGLDSNEWAPSFGRTYSNQSHPPRQQALRPQLGRHREHLRLQVLARPPHRGRQIHTAPPRLRHLPGVRYTANAGGSLSISGYRVGDDGSLSLLVPDGKTATTAALVTDLATSRTGRYLYSRLSDGTLGAFRVGRDGSLTSLPVGTGLPTGTAGIAARYDDHTWGRRVVPAPRTRPVLGSVRRANEPVGKGEGSATAVRDAGRLARPHHGS
jgi:hypothetical protein